LPAPRWQRSLVQSRYRSPRCATQQPHPTPGSLWAFPRPLLPPSSFPPATRHRRPRICSGTVRHPAFPVRKPPTQEAARPRPLANRPDPRSGGCSSQRFCTSQEKVVTSLPFPVYFVVLACGQGSQSNAWQHRRKHRFSSSVGGVGEAAVKNIIIRTTPWLTLILLLRMNPLIFLSWRGLQLLDRVVDLV